MKLMGNVKDKNVIMIDDIIDSAGTACKACQLLKDNGAKDIYFFASHGLLSGNADEKISNSHFTKVIITNIVPNKFSNDSKIEIIDVSWLCSEAIRRVQIGQSLKSLYDDGDFIYKLKFV